MTDIQALFPQDDQRSKSPRVKFCGLTHADDVHAAVACGVDLLGFNVACGPRKISVAAAAELVALVPRTVVSVILFVDADEATIRSTMALTRATAVQLHGREAPELAQRLRADYLVIKAHAIHNVASLMAAASYPADVQLFDTATSGSSAGNSSGGSGISWDHQLLNHFDCERPWMIAGGLKPGNAVAAASTGAWGLDVSSGIEASPGRKDARVMEDFMRAVRSVVRG